ncbi:MAG TPA: hypothetical protein VLU24_14410, partial [Mycobacterium sp.]|nr:hypothetical protein [Mycobacterium sp.]
MRALFVVVALAVAGSLYAPPASLAQAPPPCAGDCTASRVVHTADLIMMVNIALESADAAQCPNGIPAGKPMTIALIVEAVSNALHGCPTGNATFTPPPTSTATATIAPPTPTPTETPIPPTPHHFCDLPGSVLTTVPGIAVVPGGPADAPDLSFLHLPVGFCAHFFAQVGNARQLRFAPGGELFVASPTCTTTGGGPGGQSAIIVLPDDNHDGVADAAITFLGGPCNPGEPLCGNNQRSSGCLPATQGLLFTGGYFYYQDGTKIRRVPYKTHDRSPSGPNEQVANIGVYTSPLHWPKALDADDDGTIYVGNGGDEGEACDLRHPFHGGILKLDGSPGGAQVAKGFRNPISLRCARGHNMCFAIELTRDYSTAQGGREKLLPIRDGDDWGFPCCATRNIPFPDIRPVPDCSMVAAEIDSFIVGHTPFDLDFETGKWPEPWKNHVFVPLHGAYGTWEGASVIAIDFDAMTGEVLPGSNLGGMFSGAMSEFASGWAKAPRTHGRPANVAFAPD